MKKLIMVTFVLLLSSGSFAKVGHKANSSDDCKLHTQVSDRSDLKAGETKVSEESVSVRSKINV